ncbi:iron-containing alcohol dehydrogenase [Ilumatobacter sp.]|uniref:iron-containing alcohol dehydrogenase n=1 Tax=Ilumatobacter sp. TaxID=1967498 RepID=UPI003B521FD5
MTLSTNWSFPTAIRIGAGCIEELGATCDEHGIERPLIVTDPGMFELEAFAAVQSSLPKDTAVFCDIKPNPVGANVDAGVDVFRSGGHDGVVAVGGGSALDCGKVIALQAGQTRPMWDFEDIGDNWKRADADAIAPIIAVPTTAGTGSEVGRAGVVIDEDSKRKVIIFHPAMLPVAVLCDPELTVGLPRNLTVGTGMDALSHSLEALCAPAYHPTAHGIGLEGCRLVLEHLPRVVADPENIGSRTQMMAAAAMGAVAFQKGLGGMHALAHPIGAMFDTHHGMTNAVLMPYVLAANRSAVDDPISRLAGYTGVAGGFDGFLEHVLRLRSDLGVPYCLADLGVDASFVAEIAAAAAVDPSASGNPIPFTEEVAAGVFVNACSGELDEAVG